MSNLIRVDVDELYGRKNKLLLSDLHFEIAEGETVLIAGISGCGKSTLLSLIRSDPMTDSELLNSLLQAAQMRPHYNGTVVKAAGLRIRFASQELTIDRRERVGDALAYEVMGTGTAVSGKTVDEKVRGLLKDFKIEGKGGAQIKELSGGEQRRVMIAERSALNQCDADNSSGSGGPQLLLCDEPDSGLDVRTQAHLHKMLTEYAKANKTALITVGHNLYDFNICKYDKLMLLGKGVREGSTIRYFDSPDRLRQFFGTDKLVDEDQETGIFDQLSRTKGNAVIRMWTA